MITYKLEAEMELMERHIKVLKQVILNQPVGIIKLSQILNMPEHKIRYSLRLLEQEGIIEASPSGARATKDTKKILSHLKDVLDDLERKSTRIRKEIEEIEKLEL